ncbi:MAG: hypothetical protein IJC98_06395 [Clostridia bacterium]|nr:hypothetical protein [Clostridia bacterium]
MNAYGKTAWMIPDTYYRSVSRNETDKSHEAVCVLNTSDKDAHITLTLFFEDREPRKGFSAVCPSMRTNHIRLDKIVDSDGVGIVPDTAYAILVESDTPIVVQYTRVDTSAPEMALMTTMAYSINN